MVTIVAFKVKKRVIASTQRDALAQMPGGSARVVAYDVRQVPRSFIREACETAKNPGANERQRNFVLNQALVACFQVLKGVTSEMISGMHPNQRKAIYDGLSEQIARFKP
jgi:hypothetical protein